MNDQLREAVKKLFADKKVETVVGYREHPLTKQVVPIAITNADQADQLIFDDRCVTNLARAAKPDMDKPIGVVVKGCDGRALNMKITEGDFAREEIVAIATACPGVNGPDGNPEDRCLRCKIRVSPIADVQIGDPETTGQATKERSEFVDEVRKMKPIERIAFWREAFDGCTRCYACREACPLCTCTVCITDKNFPQWIENTNKSSSNMMWHLIRAFHHAGRCVDCGECQRACPEDIPMHLLDLCLDEDVEELFGFVTGAEENQKWPFLLFDPNDKDSWLGGPTRD